MEKKKFWCHYIGSDDKPKRRSIELELLEIPNSDIKVWCEKDEENNSYGNVNTIYFAYCVVGGNIAVSARQAIYQQNLDFLKETEESTRSWAEQRFKDGDKWWTEEHIQQRLKSDRERREHYLEALQDTNAYIDWLLDKASNPWVQLCVIRACEEAHHPRLQELIALRKKCLELREHREKEAAIRREQVRKEEEERKRQEAEAEAKRLSEEETKFKNGEMIDGWDIVEIARKYKLNIHLRTIHNLQQHVSKMNGKGEGYVSKPRGKRIVFDGCFKAAKDLYKFLNEQADVKI